jgi:hypothetical protein
MAAGSGACSGCRGSSGAPGETKSLWRTSASTAIAPLNRINAPIKRMSLKASVKAMPAALTAWSWSGGGAWLAAWVPLAATPSANPLGAWGSS